MYILGQCILFGLAFGGLLVGCAYVDIATGSLRSATARRCSRWHLTGTSQASHRRGLRSSLYIGQARLILICLEVCEL
jgi:hypothetical protein